MGKVAGIKWSGQAASDLQRIFEFYFSKSPDSARRIVAEIVGAIESFDFSHQYQADEVNRAYRRIIVRHFKVLYKEKEGVIFISQIFDTRQNPAKQRF